MTVLSGVTSKKALEVRRKQTRSRYVYVFGSTLSGSHLVGASKVAYEKHGAVRGVDGARGYIGNSYGIPVRDLIGRVLSFKDIQAAVNEFVGFAIARNDLVFQVTRIGYEERLRDVDIAKMFRFAPRNCSFCLEWEFYLPHGFSIWGSDNPRVITPGTVSHL